MPSVKSADVIVVGAGLAGLAAVHELIAARERVARIDQKNERDRGGQAFWSSGGCFWSTARSRVACESMTASSRRGVPGAAARCSTELHTEASRTQIAARDALDNPFPGRLPDLRATADGVVLALRNIAQPVKPWP